MLTQATCQMLATPKPGKLTSRLPSKFARTNAALIAGVVKAADVKGIRS